MKNLIMKLLFKTGLYKLFLSKDQIKDLVTWKQNLESSFDYTERMVLAKGDFANTLAESLKENKHSTWKGL